MPKCKSLRTIHVLIKDTINWFFNFSNETCSIPKWETFCKTKPILKIYASPLIGLNLKYFEQKDALKDKQILKSLLKTFWGTTSKWIDWFLYWVLSYRAQHWHLMGENLLKYFHISFHTNSPQPPYATPETVIPLSPDFKAFGNGNLNFQNFG